VIYVRTFSKTLFPALRLGFAVLPPALVSRFARGRLLADRHSPTAEQAVLTDFILSGRFARHVRRMSRLCAERQRTFLSLASTELGSLLDCRSASAGLRVVGLLPPGVSDRLVAEEARRRGIAVEALSEQSMGSSKDRGLVFGYAPFLARETCDGLRQLATAIRAVRGAR
jgi:GntR family transcriptional regulator/MocR family aminotransferase